MNNDELKFAWRDQIVGLMATALYSFEICFLIAFSAMFDMTARKMKA
jgi:hypothetical protein